MGLSRQDKRALRTVADTIVAERKRRRLTQEGVAHRSSVSLSTIQRMEEGSTDSRLSNYIQVARAIGIPPAELLARVEPPS